ncbi:hypothetical protein SAMD00019534_036690 [Acytostelium subglobosum LB1]|uniref:hypothetical protein n=1 Tax=Acytostelium subglobosum LB1 TaxID=1410327 RepID=UPI000644DA71|nr:hypothetical protein SAMD00019534_036690 [Acytostelium subglobosum LB1]GAM20494.1 hypothetical protein SAMD00019534_036690 [Acytostelium subglobosum LB1]|eukprot:XP_012760015.1 hypothetical protein SAMD00019534_036690 [Acytostelium subglobosum LB1]
MKINFLTTGCSKITFDNVNKDDTIDSLKLRLFREHSDLLPQPTTVFESPPPPVSAVDAMQVDNKPQPQQSQQTHNNEEDEDVEMKDHTNLPAQILHPYQIRLIFNGKQLENLSTVEDNNIADDVTLLVAASPFYLLKGLINADKKEAYSTSDKIFTGAKVNDRVGYVLCVDDQVSDTSFQFSKLEALTPKEASDLLVRMPALEAPPTKQDNFKMYQSKRPSESSGFLSSLLGGHKKASSDTDSASNLHVEFDSLSLAPQPKREEAARIPIVYLTKTPTGSNVYVHRIQVVFNRPFIPLAATLSELTVPFQLEPQVPGAKWHWIDGVTCVCSIDMALAASDRKFAQSTTYTITPLLDVFRSYDPEVTQSEIGQPWTFETCTQLPTFGGFNNNVEKPQLFITLSQSLPESQRATLDKLITVRSKGTIPYNTSFKLLAHDDELVSKTIQENIRMLSPDKVIIIALEQSLKHKSKYEVNIAKGLKSTEGPLMTTTVTKIEFNTPDVFSILKVRAQNGSEGTHLIVDFNQSAGKLSTAEVLADGHVEVIPKVVGFELKCHQYSWRINGDFDLDTEYKVKFRDIKSESGSTIAKDSYTATFEKEKASITVNDQSWTRKYNLDPLTRPYFQVTTKAVSYLKVAAYAMRPNQYSHYANGYNDTPLYGGKETPMQFKDLKLIKTKEVQIQKIPKKSTDTVLDLSDFFGGETPMFAKNSLILLYFSTTVNSKLVQTTKILQYTPFIINVKKTASDFIAWVTNTTTNQVVQTPLIEAYNETLNSDPNLSVVGHNGAVVLQTDDKKPIELLTATVTINKVKYTTMMPISLRHTKNTSDKPVWHVIDDLGMYRPTETVHVHGMLRMVDEDGIQTPLEYFGDNQIKFVKYTLTDTRKKEFFKDTEVKINELGSFQLCFKLPEDINLGDCRLALSCTNGSVTHRHEHTVRVLECKRKEYNVEVDVRNANKVLQCGEPFYVETVAKTFTGEIMANTMVEYKIQIDEYTPTLHTGFQFNSQDSMYEPGEHEYVSKRNPSGKHQLRLVLQDSLFPVRVNVTGTIKDLTNVSESFSKAFNVHGQYRYFGISSRKEAFVNANEPFECSLVVVKSNGKMQSDGKIRVDIKQVPWDEELPPLNVHTGEIVPSKTEPTVFKHVFPNRGAYNLKFVYERVGQPNQTFTFPLFVLGEQTATEKEYRDTIAPIVNASTPYFGAPAGNPLTNKFKTDLKLTLKDDVTTPKIGDTIEMLLTTKLTRGTGLVVLSKDRTIMASKPFQFENGEFKHQHLVTKEHFPAVNISFFVEGVGSITSDGLSVDRFACGHLSKDIKISREDRELKVELLPFRKFQTPGQDITLKSRVLNNQGKPVSNAEVMLIVADESLLKLSRKTIKDWMPLSEFYSRRQLSGETCFTAIDQTLFYRPIEKNEVVPMVASTLAITVRYLSGRVIQMTLPPSANLDEVRKVVLARDGLPFTNQRIFYKNKQLECGTLEENGITTDATLNLLIRLSGGGDDGKDEILDNLPALNLLKVRDNFNPRATFQANMFTDDNGEVSFDFKLPDNLTKYRIMLAAMTSTSFGTTEEFFTSTLPVMIRQSPPRFLNYNDECTFPVIIQNIVDFDVEVHVAFQTTNCLCEESGYKAVIPGNSRINVPLRVRAITPNSTSVVHVAVSSKVINAPGITAEFTDAVKFDFPVHSPSCVESNVINHISTKKNQVIKQAVKFNNWQQLDQEIGGITVNLSSTTFTKYSESYKYLLDYKLACSEQISSKLMCLAVLRNMPELLEKDIKFDEKKVDETMKGMFEQLLKRRNDDGSFKYWDNSTNTYEYVNLYVYWVLLSLEDIGVEVPVKLMAKCNKYLGTFIDSFDLESKQYKADSHTYLAKMAFACYITERYTVGVTADVQDVADSIINDSCLKDYQSCKYLEIVAYLLPFYLPNTKILTKLENNLTITGTMAYFNTGEMDGIYSSTRGNCLLIQSIDQYFSDSHLLPKLISGLETKFNTDRCWYNTQDHAYILHTVYQYFSKEDKLSQKFKAQVYLNDHTLYEQPVNLSQESPFHSTFIPMKTLIKNQGEIFIEKQGKGDLFYSFIFDYASLNQFYKSVSGRGFMIKRTFLPLGKPDDVQYSVDANTQITTCTIKSGARIKVKVDIDVEHACKFVVIEDRLPAGLEPTNVTPYRHYWYDHMNLRDKGAEVFADNLYRGTHSFTYNVVALCHGNYICPPAKIEEMYCPSTFGRTDTIIVKVI